MFVPRFRGRGLLLVFPSLLVVIGCQNQPKGPPPPLATPAMLTQVTHYTGTPLSGPRLAVADVGAPKDSFDVSVKWVAVAAPPAGVQGTLSSQSRLIIAGQSGAPMLASPDLTNHILFAQGSAVAPLNAEYGGPATIDLAPIASLNGALPPKVTAAFSAAISAGPLPRERFIIRIAQAAGPATAPSAPGANSKLEMTLEIAQNNSVSTTQPSIAQSETAVFDRTPIGGRDQLAFVIPMTFSDSPARALIALVDITSPSNAASLAACQADLQASAEDAARQPNTAAVEGSAWAGYDSALSALWRPTDRRSALVFLAAQTSAHICEDTSLVADDPMLEKLATTIAQQAATATEPHTEAALSWLLDRAAFQLLVLSDAPSAGAATVPLAPELKTVLTVYSGEPARHSGSLDDIAHQATGRQDLENRLTAENLVFLTDASPASRVRAFDWLKARGLSPAGFDPLGPAKQRREALDKALAAESN
jgi:hypothetical protein